MVKLKESIIKYLSYIEDLQSKLYRGVLLFAAVFIVGFLYAGKIIKTALENIHLNNVTVVTSAPFQFADVAMDVGFFLATLLVTPYLIWSFYSFISPALKKEEKRKLFKSVPVSIGLFVFGFAYGFFILYYALELLAEINTSLGIENFWNISEVLSQMFLTAALLGLIFEFPLLLTLLIKMGMIDTKFLKDKRRLVYFLIFCLVSLLPPTDGLSLVAMSLPLLLLYELTILLNNKQKHVWTRD